MLSWTDHTAGFPKLGSRVRLFNGSQPSIYGAVVAFADYYRGREFVSGYIVELEKGIDSPEGYYVRCVAVSAGECELAGVREVKPASKALVRRTQGRELARC